MIGITTALLICLSACGSAESKAGREAYDKGDYEEAALQYTDALKTDLCSENCCGLGMSYLELGEYEQAEAAFAQALTLDENDRAALRGLGITALRRGDAAEAREYFDKALSLSESAGAFEYDLLKYRAAAEEKTGDYAAAEATYGVLIELGESRPFCYSRRGNMHLKQSDIEAAMADYEEALKLDPDDLTLYLDIYSHLKWSGYLEQGTEILKAAMEVDGSGDEFHRCRGLAAYFLGEYAAAAQEWSAIREEEPQVALWRGQAYEQLGKLESAYSAYSHIMDLNEEDPAVYNLLGLYWAQQNDYEQALTFFQKGLKMPEADVTADLYFNEAVAYEYMGDYSSALTKFRAYVEKYGRDAAAEHEIDFLRGAVSDSTS